MSLTFYVVLLNCFVFAILAAHHYISQQKNIFIMTDIKSQLQSIDAKNKKAYGEITRKLQRLTDAINSNGDKLSPESQAVLDELNADADKFDAIVDDTEDQQANTGTSTGEAPEGTGNEEGEGNTEAKS